MHRFEPAQVTTHEADGVRVITPVGDFDLATLAPFRDAVQAAIAEERSVILDLTDTTFIDSTVLGVIAGARLGCERNERWLRIVAPRSNVRRVLQLMALDTVIEICPTIEGALGREHRAVSPAG